MLREMAASGRPFVSGGSEAARTGALASDDPRPSSSVEGVGESARAPLEGRSCDDCGRPLKGRQRRACSGRCRAALSRRRRAEEIREALTRACECLTFALQHLAKG